MSLLKVINDIRQHAGFEQFMKDCDELGYVNNSSEKAMDFHRFTNDIGQFWGLENNGRMVAMAGCHIFDDYDPEGFRLQYRGCEIPGTDVKKGLAKGHWNSMTWRELIPYELELGYKFGIDKFYITTNKDNTNDRTMGNMAKQGYLELVEIKNLNGKEQSIWRFNDEKYLEVRNKLPIYTVEPPPLIRSQ
jgi:hypothetical protein